MAIIMANSVNPDQPALDSINPDQPGSEVIKLFSCSTQLSTNL